MLGLVFAGLLLVGLAIGYTAVRVLNRRRTAAQMTERPQEPPATGPVVRGRVV